MAMKSKQKKLEIWAKHAERLDVVLPCGCEAHFNTGYDAVWYDRWACQQSAPLVTPVGEKLHLHRRINTSIYAMSGLWRGMAAAAYGMALRDLGGLPAAEPLNPGPGLIPIGTRVLVPGRSGLDEAVVKGAYPKGSSTHPLPHYVLDFIGQSDWGSKDVPGHGREEGAGGVVMHPVTWTEAIFACAGLLIGWFLAPRLLRRTTVIRQEATVDTLDHVLRLDCALYDDKGDVLPGNRPHIGLWIYQDDDGRIHVDSRHSPGDRNTQDGATAGEALLNLQSMLQARISARRAAFARAETNT